MFKGTSTVFVITVLRYSKQLLFREFRTKVIKAALNLVVERYELRHCGIVRLHLVVY